MSDVPLHRTQMGHRFIEHTVPELVRQLARIADALERLLAAQEPDAGAAHHEKESPQ